MVVVTQYFLQSSQAHARSGHIASEGVSKPVGIGMPNAGDSSFVAKQPPQSLKGHRHSALRSLERQKHLGFLVFVFPNGPLPINIKVYQFKNCFRKWNKPLLSSFAKNTNRIGNRVDVLKLKREDLTGSEAAGQHQCHDGPVPVGFKGPKEGFCFIRLKSANQLVGHLQSQCPTGLSKNWKYPKSGIHRQITSTAHSMGVGSNGAGSRNQLIETVTVKNVDGVHSPINRAGRGVATPLVLNKSDQRLYIDSFKRRRSPSSPSIEPKKYHQIKCVGAYRSLREASCQRRLEKQSDIPTQCWREPPDSPVRGVSGSHRDTDRIGTNRWFHDFFVFFFGKSWCWLNTSMTSPSASFRRQTE